MSVEQKFPYMNRHAYNDKHYTCTDDNTGHRVGQSQVIMTEITEVCVAIVQADTFNYLHH